MIARGVTRGLMVTGIARAGESDHFCDESSAIVTGHAVVGGVRERMVSSR